MNPLIPRLWSGALIFTTIVVLGVAACGRYEIKPEPVDPPSPDQPVVAGKVIIAAFGAPWCSACHSEIPALSARLAKLPADQRAKIEFRVYVLSGQNPSTPPNQGIADAYVKDLHLVGAIGLPDPWRSTLFKKWVGGTYIPGGAVLDSSERVIKQFRGGANWDVTDIVAEAVKNIR